MANVKILESRLQAKCIAYLEQNLKWVVIKISAATKAGEPDLICCDKKGYFWAFEIKAGTAGIVSKLQEYKIERIRKNNGKAYVIYSFDDLVALTRNMDL